MVGGINITLANVIVAVVIFSMIVGLGITIGRHTRRGGGFIDPDSDAVAPRQEAAPAQDAIAKTARKNASGKKSVPAKR